MGQVKFKVIGSGDAFACKGKFNTCFYVSTTQSNFLIDCGATSLVALHQNGISTDDIDTIIITHFHGDHYGGIPFILLDARILKSREKPLTIISPPGCKKRLTTLIEALYPQTSDLLWKLNVDFIEYKEGKVINVNNIEIEAFPVIHSEPALPHAVRIKVEDKIIAYSGDTEWTDSLISVADGADLFIIECNFFDSKVGGHLDYSTILEHESDLKCSRLMLTHMGDEMFDNLSNIHHTWLEDGLEFIVE